MCRYELEPFEVGSSAKPPAAKTPEPIGIHLFLPIVKGVTFGTLIIKYH